VARPAVRTRAGHERPPGANGEHHVAVGETVGVAMLQEQKAVGVGDVVALALAERTCRGMDRLFTAFDLDEDADRRLVDCDHDIVGGKLLAILLVAEPDVEAERFEDGEQHGTVGDDGFMLFANLDQSRDPRTLEGQQALAALAAHPQSGALTAQHLIVGIEERVFLEPSAVKGNGPERENLRPCLVGTVEAKLDLAL
jgi:hypothetical protein